MANLITPPDDLVRDWARFQNHEDPEALWRRIATLAARWGANQELEACCEWLVKNAWFSPDGGCLKGLRADRRPQPPSLKEQALEALKRQSTRSVPSLVSTNDCDTIRRALEALPND